MQVHDSEVSKILHKQLFLLQVDRIAAPTLSSIQHSKISMSDSNVTCPKRCCREETSQSKMWWCETTRHLNNLRASLVKQKILPPVETRRNSRTAAKAIVNTFVHSTRRIDEIVARTIKNGNNAKIPVYPKLRLTRKQDKKDKVPCPIAVTLVKFNGHCKCINLNC